jgi:hypothetical protein
LTKDESGADLHVVSDPPPQFRLVAENVRTKQRSALSNLFFVL